MELTIREIRTGAAKLQQLLHMSLPAGVSFTLADNYGKLQSVADRSERKRLEILRDYAQQDSEGNIVTIKDTNGTEKAKFIGDNREAYEEAIEDFLDTQLEVSITTIDIEALDGYDIPGNLLCLWMFARNNETT